MGDRINGTCVLRELEITEPVGRYREFEPCPELRDFVRRFFTFAAPAVPDRPRRAVRLERVFASWEVYTTPLFADSHVSMSFSFGSGYRVDGLWNQSEERNCGHVIGAMSAAHPAVHGERVIEVGAYFRPLRAKHFFAAAPYELSDHIHPLVDLWGRSAVSAESYIGEANNDDQRVERFERALLQRLRVTPAYGSAIDLAALLELVQSTSGRISVDALARHAGASRQHLARLFHEEVGMPPKLVCRLARFRGALAYAAREGSEGGAGLAAELGYVDQSHMIAEFREFSGLTPKPLLLRQRVHPFSGVAEIADADGR